MATGSARRRSIVVALAGAVAASLLIGGILGATVGASSDRTGGLPLPAIVAGAAACLLVGLYAVGPWWRRIDEMAREAHKSAFWWGGNYALGVAALSATVVTLLARDGVRFSQSDSDIASGVLLAFLVQAVGYTIAWSWWWLRRR